MNFKTFTVLLKCNLCGSGMPMQGPVRTLRCSVCLGTMTLSDDEVVEILQAGAEGMRMIMINLGNSISAEFMHGWGLACPDCSLPVDLSAFPVGVDSEVTCAGCKAGISSYPAPQWLKDCLPTIEQFYGAEREASDADGSGPSPDISSHARPVIMKCPGCGAPLEVGSDSARTVPCGHCDNNVYLPDDLWLTLHPRKQVKPWAVSWHGEKLLTGKELREQEEERRRAELNARLREEQLTQQDLRAIKEREERAREEQRKRDQRRRYNIYALLWVMVVALAATVWIVWELRVRRGLL